MNWKKEFDKELVEILNGVKIYFKDRGKLYEGLKDFILQVEADVRVKIKKSIYKKT
ncbi:MAG: hypothetical protein QQN63_11060 [Nitrosopumilus sp.]